MFYTEEQYEILKNNDGILYTATYCDFVRINNRKELEKLDRIYNEAFKTKSSIIGGCNRCLLRDLKKLGKEYFADKKAYEKIKQEHEELEKETEVIENKTVTKITPKKATDTVKKGNVKKAKKQNEKEGNKQ